MKCKQFTELVRDFVRGEVDAGVARSAEAHIGTCHKCAVLSQRESAASEALGLLAQSMAASQAGPHVEDRLVAEFRNRKFAGSQETWTARSARWWPVWAAAGLGVAMLGWLAPGLSRWDAPPATPAAGVKPPVAAPVLSPPAQPPSQEPVASRKGGRNTRPALYRTRKKMGGTDRRIASRSRSSGGVVGVAATVSTEPAREDSRPGSSVAGLQTVQVEATAPVLESGAAPESRRPSQEIATEFVPLRPGQPLTSEDFVQVIRVSVPRSEMLRFGIPASLGFSNARVNADVVMGQDGVAKAVRFVR